MNNFAWYKSDCYKDMKKNPLNLQPAGGFIRLSKVEMKTNEFEKRVLPLKDNLLRVAYRITGDVERSEKIVEEVMLQVWSERASLIFIEDLPSYCLMMARNRALQGSLGQSADRESFTVG